MKLLNITAFAAILFCFGGNIYAGSASTKLSSLADSLIKGYLLKPGATKAALAIFQFNCEKKLEERRVGFAVSELMSHRFVADGTFTVVERGEIGRLLQEQRLQASGAVDNDTAVKLGGLAGAGVVLLGNIQKVSGEYQVNARLVSVETGEVLASGYAELEEGVFEADAYGYMGAVPQAHPVGLYFLYNYTNSKNKLPGRTYSSSGSNYSYDPHSFKSGIPGIGLRYDPFSRLQVDIALVSTDQSGVRTVRETVTGAFPRASEISTRIFMYRGILAYQNHLFRNVKWLAGGGYSIYKFNAGHDSYGTPVIHARLECLLQRRIGLSLAANYNLNGKVISSMRWMGSDGVQLLKLNSFALEPSLAIYF